MPILYNHEERYYLTTSYKVMYSTLMNQQKLKKTSVLHALGNQWASRVWSALSCPHFLLVRNPYTRVESLFRNKFRESPLRLKMYPHSKGWQDIQILFAEKLRPDARTSKMEDRLLDIDFNEYVEVLPELYTLDVHLWPQYDHSHLRYRGIHWSMAYQRTLKMENEKDLSFIQSSLNLDLSKKVNAVEPTRFPITWSSSSMAIVNTIYKKDFLWLGYDMSSKQRRTE